jgi:hypothetical protein
MSLNKGAHMKKLILGLFIAAFVSVGVGTASAAPVPAQTDVTGVITKNQIAVVGATVTVMCNGNTLTDTSNAQGSYLAVFTTIQCPFGSTVKVTAQKGGNSGVASGTIQGITTKLNLAIVNVAIPEYGLIGALTAGGTGFGIIAFTRRRQKQASF